MYNGKTPVLNNLASIFESAKTTYQVLCANMIELDTLHGLLETNYTQVDRKSVIKLLLRNILLYEGRRDVQNIFKHIIELEAIMQPKKAIWRILLDS